MIPALLFAWGLLLPGGVGAQGPFSWDSAPPGSLPALSSAELRVAGALRRSRADRSLDHAALSAEISAAGQSVLQPCLNTLELGWVAACAPGEVPQVLSSPQIEIVLSAVWGWVVILAFGVPALGVLVFETVRRRFALIWGDIQTEIAAAQQAKEAS